MFDHLQIYDKRERCLVGTADMLLAAALAPVRLFGGRAAPPPAPRRILLLRLERIGDLLMSLPAIAAVRALAPNAAIDLVVGSWNAPIARLVREVDRVEVVDAAWLSRGGPSDGAFALVRRSQEWRRRRYDLAINFEGDPRSHLLMWRTGATERVGFAMAGGGPLLTRAQGYDPTRHVADNLLRLVETAFGRAPGSVSASESRLPVPGEARIRAEALLAWPSASVAQILVGINVGGGREIKQWDPTRFARVAELLAAKHQARFVFTGADEDRAVVNAALANLPSTIESIDVTGRADLLTLAAVLERCTVFITGDTGPMHLAAAVGTPVVAIFGPSDPRRWGPLSARAEVVYGEVPCRPCNRIRRPPARCVGHVPDCLAAVTPDQVVAAAERQIARAGLRHGGA
ncbi:MAG: glycosyltransferase family 9 protein [Bacteroidales bacterium]